MNPIYKGLEEGYSPEDILGYLSKAIPQFLPSIRKAKSAGYTVQQILGFLSKNFDPQDRKGMSESQRHAANTRQESEMTKYGLKMAGAAAALPIAGIAARSALSRALPSSIQTMLPGIADQASTNVPSVQNSGGIASAPTQGMPQAGTQLQPSSSQPPISPTSLAQPAQALQAQGKTINVDEILNRHKSKEKVEQLLKAGNDPERISAYFQKFSDSTKKAIEKETGKTFQEVISEYQSQKPHVLTENVPEIEEITEVQEKISPKIEKSSIVASPKGMGQVKEIRNGKALIDIDGKLHKIEEDELVQSPLPEKDLADLYDDLISGIEEGTGQQVSRNVEWAGYDPINNELAYKPHGSDKLYAYGDISPEDVEQLTNLLTQRKSTGENFIGAWKAGTTSPIGAAMYQLIKKLQAERGGKGNEYKNKYETIYDAIEPAKKAAKKKHAERKKKT